MQEKRKTSRIKSPTITRQQRGLRGQAWARRELVQHGFKIIEECFQPGRVWIHAGEVDFFCYRDDSFHVIEVKTHRYFPGQVLLSDRQRRRLHEAQKVLRERHSLKPRQKILTWLLWLNWVDGSVEFLENP